MNEMMSTGVEIMLVGMGSVFSFLGMLIVAVNLMATTIQRFFPDTTPELAKKNRAETVIDTKVIAAVTSAVHQYRVKHTKN
ncbi:MAG: OadG family protein [Methylococcales bacterium]|nr:OadG family protein [Methylococcales bacterium]